MFHATFIEPGVRVKEVLDKMLKPLKLEYVIRGDAIVIRKMKP